MMVEYIERESLIADIEKRYCRPCEAEGKDYNHVRCRACWVDDMVGEIEQAVDADVVPVVHGRWIPFEHWVHKTFWKGKACSVCNANIGHKTVFKFCPNCGARMGDS